MIIPFSYDGQAMLWQQEAGYGFRMTGGYVSATFPDALWASPIVRAIYGAPMPPFPEREFRMLARDRKVDVVLLRATRPEPWEAVLRAAYGQPRSCGRHARLAGTRHLAALARVSPMTHRIAVLAGDGVGPEVVDEARRCVDELKLEIEWSDLDWGSDHWVEHGVMMPPDAVERLLAFDFDPARRRRAARHPRPRHALGAAAADPPAPRPVGQRPSRAAARGRAVRARRPRARRHRHGVRARELRGRVLRRRRPRAPGPSRRGRHRDGRVHARGHRARRRARLRARRRAARRRHERDQVQRVALRLRALGRGRRRGRRAPSRTSATSTCSWTRSRRAWCCARTRSTWSSPPISSATS